MFVAFRMPCIGQISIFFFFNDTATTEIYTLSLHDALPISTPSCCPRARARWRCTTPPSASSTPPACRSEEHSLNSSHRCISYAVFCLKKKKQNMVAAQAQLKNETVEASAGGCMVMFVVSGDLEVKSITIAPDAIDPEDPELLQDMVLAAVNEGLRSAQELAANKMGGLTGGLDLGGLGLPGI